MEAADRKPYETPHVIASIDALNMVTDADGLAVGCSGSKVCTFDSPSHLK